MSADERENRKEKAEKKRIQKARQAVKSYRNPDATKRQKVLSVVGLVLFIVACGLILYFVGMPMIRLASDPAAFRALVDSKGIWGRILFVGMSVLQVVVAVIPGEPLELGAGYAFGFWEGTLLCMVSVLIGSALVFLLTRKVGMRIVQVFFSKEKIESISWLQNTRRLNVIMFIVFFIPGTPKDLLTYVAGLTPIKMSHFLLLSTLARIPSIITSTWSGHALGVQNYTMAIVAFAIMAVVSLVGLIIYNRISKKGKEKESRTAVQAEQKTL